MAFSYFSNVYLNAGVVLLGFVILGKIFLFFSQRVVLMFTHKTKTEVDDLIVKKTNYPIYLTIIILGAKFVLDVYSLFPEYSIWLHRALNTIVYLLLLYAAIGVFRIIINHWARLWAKRTKAKLDESVTTLFHRTASILLWIVGILFIIQSWGIEITPLLASLGIAGLAVALALQPVLSNIFSGVSLIVDKNISVGDVIEATGMQRGKVTDIGLRSTKIRTFDNQLLIIPNSALAATAFVNVTQPSPSIRLKIPFSVEYGSNVEKVKKLIKKELEKITVLDKEHDIFIRFNEMGPSSLNFNAYFYVKRYEDRPKAIDTANTLIYNALNKHKINIPYPQMDVHLKKK